MAVLAIIGIIGVFIGMAMDSYSLSAIIFICAMLYAWPCAFIAGKLAMAMTGAQEIERMRQKVMASGGKFGDYFWHADAESIYY